MVGFELALLHWTLKIYARKITHFANQLLILMSLKQAEPKTGISAPVTARQPLPFGELLLLVLDEFQHFSGVEQGSQSIYDLRQLRQGGFREVLHDCPIGVRVG
ncbi:hypothetical protein [Rhizobium leguminosarum]|uniref:hypothetical protein n=1 Tax=Rhizobium leguminosarum TaxID=384 RepID=UPI001C947552|nr:hypothetical protein [Rhizobium leguminosarum]MBY5657759.1 hypothetical protein [Rhizobium leguminosarum]